MIESLQIIKSKIWQGFEDSVVEIWSLGIQSSCPKIAALKETNKSPFSAKNDYKILPFQRYPLQYT
jgi:hypothetical protein